MSNSTLSEQEKASWKKSFRNPDNPYVERSPYDTDRGNLIGIDPSRISKQDLLDLGHARSPLKSIRAKCLDCCGGSESEVRKCTALHCPSWSFRMGRNVFHAKAKRGTND